MCPARILPCVFPKELEHHRGHGLPGGKGLFFFFFFQEQPEAQASRV